MSKDNVEKTITQIPSIRLSKGLIEDLSKIIEEQREECLKSDKYTKVDYTYKGTRNEINSHSKGFLKYDIPRGLDPKSLRSEVLKIEIWIWPQYSSYRHFDVSSTNPTLVEGITGRIARIFETYKTPNEILYTKKGSLLLSLPSMLTVYLIFLLTTKVLSVFTKVDVFLPSFLIALGVGFFSGFGWRFLFEWLYPYIETESSRRSMVKKLVYFVIGSLLVTIMAEYILRLLPSV